MIRGYNFSAGPAMLPEVILKDIQAELLDWQGHDMSVMEIGHRTEAFRELLASATASLRELLHVPENYHILFLGGAARTQFAMIPMNFLSANDSAGYLISGVWSSMAFKEASYLKNAYVVASGENNNYLKTPPEQDYILNEDSVYIYYTPNETIDGVRFSKIPDVGERILIADMTSCLLTELVDVSRFGLIFAGAQKNIANAGLTVVIVRDELLSLNPQQRIPAMLDYRVHVDNQSMYATPPVFNCYVAAKMFEWIKEQGGVDVLYQRNCLKAERLYSYIDSSDFYYCDIEKESRSKVNICFKLSRQELTESFIAFSSKQKLYALQGHRLKGGVRASIYNAMPMSGVEQLIDCMREFAEEYNH
ncbi:3-phosphoserine/phosphohydroxythreonine transaminase [Legionella israelensis]|uniref:Phosphoserine aminotransferase n=1 Tax=Legionella israelensis TaxID=454 RepID=A0AAX1EGX6_9GAMM|nr:3-phosphoserine/phosphohydroxythreonine transaminase [Legionella israelensis]QBR84240.1 3-phosphoserine/phosphohydroxythreonine transaminase [Legionella israelensis]